MLRSRARRRSHQRRRYAGDVPVRIRPELPGDAPAIEAVTRAAFATAAHASGTEPAIVAALRASGALTLSLVATDGDAVVGHVAISAVTLSDGTRDWYGLGPLSVAPRRQRQGIGSALVRAALETLRARSAAGCVVLGDPTYYGRFGFAAGGELTLAGVPPAYFQALAFTRVPRATVRYAPPFAAHG